MSTHGGLRYHVASAARLPGIASLAATAALSLTLLPHGAATAQTPVRSSTELAFGIPPEAERKLTQQIAQCESEKRWQEMAALCYDAIARTQKQFYYDRLLVALDNQKRPSELADAMFSYMLRFPSLREQKYTPWATAMREAGRADEAVAQFRQWVESMPGEAAAWTALAALQVDLRHFSDAEETLRKATATVRDDAARLRLRLGLARLYTAMSDADRAIAAYDELITMAPSVAGASAQEALSEFSRFLAATNRLDAYVAKLEPRLADPAKVRHTLDTLLAIIDQRTHPKALDYRRRLAALDPSRPNYLQLRELAERRAATNDEIAVLQDMLVQFPELRDPWQRRLLDLYVATGDSIKAIPILQDSLKDNASSLAFAQAAGTALSFGDRGLALNWLEESMKRNPDTSAKAAIARVLMRLDRHEEALSLSMSMASAATGRHLRNEIMAELEKAGKREMVADALRKMTAAQPTNAVPWTDLARFYLRASDPTNAAAAWKRVVEIAPSPESYQNLISTLRMLADSGSLMKAMEDSFKAYQGVETGRALVPMLVKAGRTRDAMEIQRQVVSMLKTPAEKTTAQLALVRLLVAEQRTAEARSLIDETLALSPSAAVKEELDGMRGVLEANERHAEFVVKALAKADLSRRDPGAQRSAAQALRITGHHARAAEYYRRALAIEDQTATRWDLAYVLTSAKQYREAAQAYRDLLSRDLSPQERDSAIKAIAESYDALGDEEATMKFLTDSVDEIKTPYVKTWATARIQALRSRPK